MLLDMTFDLRLVLPTNTPQALTLLLDHLYSCSSLLCAATAKNKATESWDEDMKIRVTLSASRPTDMKNWISVTF